jgi:hypothetical protein
MSEEQEKQQGTEEEKENTENQNTDDNENQGSENVSNEENKETIDNEEFDRLKKENEELRKKVETSNTQSYGNQQVQAPKEIDEKSYENAAVLFSNMSDEEYETKWADKYQGMSKIQVATEMKNNARDIIIQKQQAKLSVRDLLDNAVVSNPRLSKLKSDIKTYLDKLPLKEKTDENNLIKHMEDAENWALGRYYKNNKPKQQNKNIGNNNMERVNPNTNISDNNKNENENKNEYIGENSGNKIRVKTEDSSEGANKKVIHTIVSQEEKINFGGR